MASLSHFGLFVLLLCIGSRTEAMDELYIVHTTDTSSLTEGRVLTTTPERLVALEQAVVKLESSVSRIEANLALSGREPQEERSCGAKKSIVEKDIVTAINQGHFAIAEQKMLELNDPVIVANIVGGMFAKSDREFGVLVNLAKSLKNNALRYQVLTKLNYEANESDHIGTRNLIALAKCLSEQLPGYQHDGVIGIRSFKKLLDQITEATITTFVDVLKWRDDYQTNSEVRTLAADIAEWPDVSEKVMIGLVSGVFGNVESIKIMKAVCNHSDPWQALVGLDTLIERLKEPFTGSIAFDIAYHHNEIVNRGNLHPTVQYYARRMKAKIPECVRSLTTLTNICIWNKHKASFLIATQVPYKTHLSVVSGTRWENGSIPIGAAWRHQDDHEKLVLKNVAFGSILHASDISDFGFHRVFTTVQKGLLDDKNAWFLEPAGDSCFLRNYWNTEYLYASSATFSQGEGNIAGTKHNAIYQNAEFAWRFINC